MTFGRGDPLHELAGLARVVADRLRAAGLTVLAVDGLRRLSTVLRTERSDREEKMWLFARGALGLLERALAADTNA